MDELVQWNERYKGSGLFADNAALAFFVGSGVQVLSANSNAVLVVLGAVLGLAFLWLGWYVRSLIQSEVPL